MKLAAMILAVAMAAAAATVTVQETRMAAGDRTTLATGTLTIAPAAAFTAADGTRVERPVEVRVVNGRFSVALEPGTYTVRYAIDAAAPKTRTWVVPAGGPYRIDQVEQAVAVAAPVTVPTSQLTTTIADGQCLQASSGKVTGGACGSGGAGSPGLTWNAAGSLTWSTI